MSILEEPQLRGVCPLWVTPLHDFSIENTWYKWFKLTRQDDTLDLVECGIPCHAPPIWENEDEDWATRLEQMDRDTIPSIYSDWETWGMKQGICPGQPFLVEMDIHVSGGSYDPYDTEVEYVMAIVRRMPRTSQEALRAWEKHRTAEQTSIRRLGRRLIVERKLLMLAQKWQMAYCPRALELFTTFNMGDAEKRRILASGSLPLRPSEADKATAFKDLVRKFRQVHPNAPLEPVLKLADSIQIPVDKYTRIKMEPTASKPESYRGRPSLRDPHP